MDVKSLSYNKLFLQQYSPESPKRVSEPPVRRRRTDARETRRFFDENDARFRKVRRRTRTRRLQSSGQRRNVLRFHDGQRQLPNDVVHVLIAAWRQCCKTFYGSNLQIFIQSQSVCQNRFEKLVGDERSSLSLKLINYRQKGFITLAHGGRVIKLFTAMIDGCW